MAKASFKTAYLQREIVLDVALADASNDFSVKQLVTLNAAADGAPQYLTAAATLAAATHIIAQSDMTMEYGHVPVENRDYAYSDVVKRTVTGAAAVAASPLKRVAVFKIVNADDVIVEA